ncbi:mannan endo-1,4-beta-mannosidase 2-like [Gossypium australe]|uniref:Mannan endo-1,4-beta-mannosidase 2-like n=1 Tax=Gossypium australe TaxID=47621 RepID=A0A5B6X299_9ROSI|nr:mannan endo-1,4-beta-mannosidase 2-like [Gossypium australe]
MEADKKVKRQGPWRDLLQLSSLGADTLKLKENVSQCLCVEIRKTMGGNGVLYPILGFASCVAFIYMSFGDLKLSSLPKGLSLSFVERNGSHFILDSKPLYVNGWN